MQREYYFPCSADHEQDWQPYPVDPYSAICVIHTNLASSNTSGTDFKRHVPIKIPKFSRHVPIKILKFNRHVPIIVFFSLSIYQSKRRDDSPASSQITLHNTHDEGCDLLEGGLQGARTKNRTLGARSGPPVGHRQPRPPDVGAPQNPKFNRHVAYTHRNPLFSRSSRRMRHRPRAVSHLWPSTHHLAATL